MGKRAKKQRQQPIPPIVEPPPEIKASIEKITTDDRLWFEANPGATFRTRPAAPNEFWPVMTSDCVLYVLVRQVWPGFRLRKPVIRLHRPKTERVQ